MEGVTGSSDYLDVYGRKPADYSPSENESMRFLQKRDYLRTLNKKPEKNCIGIYMNIHNEPHNWEKTAFLDLMELDCSLNHNDDAASIAGLENQIEQMNVICENDSKFSTINMNS